MDEHPEGMMVMVNGTRRRVVTILADSERFVVSEGWQLVSYPQSECRVVS